MKFEELKFKLEKIIPWRRTRISPYFVGFWRKQQWWVFEGRNENGGVYFEMFVGFSCGFKELEQEEGTWRRRTNLKNKTVVVCAWVEQEDSMRNWRRQWHLKKTMELEEEHST